MPNKTNKQELIDKLDALLPQTQCGLCDYAACQPYAKALATDNASIDRCPPGGTETLRSIASLLEKDPSPYLKTMQVKTKKPQVAVIQEEACIGCTKCIQACPTDAIIGASKFMHTVISEACTGCELCLAPCPVDCITMLPITQKTAEQKKQQADVWRKRYQQKQRRVVQQQQRLQDKHQQAKLNNTSKKTITARQEAIRAAVLRVKAKQQANLPSG